MATQTANIRRRCYKGPRHSTPTRAVFICVHLADLCPTRFYQQVGTYPADSFGYLGSRCCINRYSSVENDLKYRSIDKIRD